MASCHGIRVALLKQVAEQPNSNEKAFRSALLDRFGVIDDLPKGKQTVKDYTLKLADRFPTDEAMQQYMLQYADIDHRVSWKCGRCSDSESEYLRGRVGNLNQLRPLSPRRRIRF